MPEKITVHLNNYRCFKKPVQVAFTLESGKTTAIVGANNVGKSTLLRFFYEMRHLLSSPSSGVHPVNSENKYSFKTTDLTLNQLGNPYELHDLIYLYPDHDQEGSLNFSIASNEWRCEFTISKPPYSEHQIAKEITDLGGPGFLVEVDNQFRNALYFGAHRNLINGNQNGASYYDLIVGGAFTEQWSRFKSGIDTTNAKLAQKAENLIANLLGWVSVNIHASPDGKQLFLTRNNQQRSLISELGAGVSELVICIVTAAIKKPSWILIDEPESHLHPSMQIKFIDALEQLATYGVIFTTHAIGLARSSADSIFLMQQDEKGRSYLKPFESIGNFSQLMGELSFSQMHDLGYSALLLCEGVTEIKTLRQILRKWKLDASVMLIPLGGDALIDPNRQDELNEFNRFNAKVFVIIDSERKHANDQIPKRDKFIKECEDLFGKNSAIQTKRRAIENYFTEDAIRNGLRSNEYAALGPFDELKSSPKAWGKNNNHKIAAEMSKEDWLNTDIGEFIEFISVQINSMKSYLKSP